MMTEAVSWLTTVSHRVMSKHTPWDEYRTRFPPKPKGQTHATRMVPMEVFRRESCIDACIARRIQYALPVVQKPSFEKSSEGVCYRITLV